MELVFSNLLAALLALWWPFCRVLAMFSVAPVFGDGTLPVRMRVLLALVLSFVMLPVSTPAAAIDPFSLHGVVETLVQCVVGVVIGLAFQLSMAVISMLGFVAASQMGLAMAVMNDPINGGTSDVLTTMLSILCILVFFSIDGHLVLAGVVGASFRAWPVGAGFDVGTMRALVFNVGWIFSAALLLALPLIFSTLVVQIGFGLLSRIAPALNVFSLGFSVVTLVGVFMLARVLRFVPDHYVRMTGASSTCCSCRCRRRRMSEASSADKTEKASPQKLRKSREQGQVARSRDLATAVGISSACGSSSVWRRAGWRTSAACSRSASRASTATARSTTSGRPPPAPRSLLSARWCCRWPSCRWRHPARALVPGGWVLATSTWMPRFERLSPAKNLSRLLQPRHGIEVALALLKATVLAAVLVHVGPLRRRRLRPPAGPAAGPGDRAGHRPHAGRA
jgi:flagellar biosynthetic protein FliR